jgi:hypothetical protein
MGNRIATGVKVVINIFLVYAFQGSFAVAHTADVVVQ